MSNSGSSAIPQDQPGDQISPEPLLRTKLFIPPLRPNQVVRPRLIELLDKGLDRPLILVSAPAGYGKTTLLAGWLRQASIRSAWLSLDKRDNDPLHFLQYFLSALHQLTPLVGVDLLGMLQGIQPPPFEALLSLVINEIDKNALPCVLVLDDFHLIEAQPILEMLTFLLEHMPAQMHLVLLSRADPPLPLARLRARDQLLNIRLDPLRFTSDEISLFLNGVLGLKLTPPDIAALEKRTEGWIAGLQLAALSMQNSPDVHSFVTAFTGSHYYIMDYLTEEVLKQQSPAVSSFLLQTSILESMCAPLCSAVVAADQAAPVDSQSMLETLEGLNLFLIALDGERRWYRYHHLFSDLLSRRLEHQYPHLLPELHRRASEWYEQNEFIPEAIQHALEAGDLDRLACLVEQKGCYLLMTGEVQTLLGWIDSIGVHAQDRPWLAIQKAWALTLAGQLEQVDRALQEAERQVSSHTEASDYATMLGTIAADRSFLANYQGDMSLAVDFARLALQNLPDPDPPESDPLSLSMRSVANLILGELHWVEGDLEGASQVYAEAIRSSRAAGDIPMLISNTENLADILLELGQLQRADRLYAEILQVALRPDGRRLPAVGSVYARLSRVYYLWDDLPAAGRYARQCLELGRLWGNSISQVEAGLMLSQAEYALGNGEAARQALQSAEQLAGECRYSPRLAASTNASLMRLWLAHGEPERASAYLSKVGLSAGSLAENTDIPYLREPEYLLLLRLFLAGAEYDNALALAERLLRKPEADGRIAIQIEVLVLQALAFQAKKELPQALAALERAIRLAQPEGCRRVFLDEGKPLAKLLALYQSKQTAPGFAAELLSRMHLHLAPDQPAAQPLIEPLSLREQEVLAADRSRAFEPGDCQ